MVSSIGGSNNGSIIQLLARAREKQNSALERLASGSRINSAKDDAAGLAIANALEASASQRSVATRNANDGTSLVRIAEGALDQLSNINIRQQELAIQASNGTLSDGQRQALEAERSALEQEADRIIATTEFNGQNVFSGSTDLQVGTGSDANSSITINSVDPSSFVNRDSIATQAQAEAAIDSLQTQQESIIRQRGELGAVESRLEVARNRNEDARVEDIAAASRITDADVAQEVANSVSGRILEQGATRAFEINNLNAENVLRLLS